MRKSDPYFEVKAEVESSLLSATALHSSYNRILLTLPIESRATSDELLSTRTELQATLSTLLYDISELDHVVCVLEEDLSASSPGPTASWKQNTKSKFGVSLEEVKKRRRWLAQVQQQVKEMKEAVEMPLDSNQPAWSYHPLLPNPISPTTSRTTGTASRNGARFQSRATDDPKHRSGKQFESSRRSRDDLESQRDTEDQTEEFYHQQESMIMKQQDETLGTISGVVDVLREQASLMGQEISEQNVMLEELEGEIDGAESKLSKANRKLSEFVEQNKNSKSSWTILILIIVLTILLLAIILT